MYSVSNEFVHAHVVKSESGQEVSLHVVLSPGFNSPDQAIDKKSYPVPESSLL